MHITALNANEMSTEALTTECGRQSEIFQRSRSSDDTYCLELFRRAIVQKDQDAWAAVYAQYQRVVATWVCSRIDCLENSADEVVVDAYARFSRAFTAQRFTQYSQLRSVMAYLQRCAFAAAYDCKRRLQRTAYHTADSLDDEGMENFLSTPADAVEQHVFGKMEATRVWECVLSHCQDDADRLIARRIFVENLKPDQVYQEQPQLFGSVQAVYQLVRNLRDRLRRDAVLAASLQFST